MKISLRRINSKLETGHFYLTSGSNILEGSFAPDGSGLMILILYMKMEPSNFAPLNMREILWWKIDTHFDYFINLYPWKPF
jgi:hypothetical protein